MPNWCDNFVTFEHDDSAKVLKLCEALEDGKGLNYLHPMPKELEDTTASHFGGINWYTWCVEHWGTKWDLTLDETPMIVDNTLSFNFQSAWAPPIGAYEKAYDDGWTVSATFCEPSMDFIGTFEEGSEASYSLSDAPNELKEDYVWAYDDDEEEDG